MPLRHKEHATSILLFRSLWCAPTGRAPIFSLRQAAFPRPTFIVTRQSSASNALCSWFSVHLNVRVRRSGQGLGGLPFGGELTLLASVTCDLRSAVQARLCSVFSISEMLPSRYQSSDVSNSGCGT
jgi:hypothetical protein